MSINEFIRDRMKKLKEQAEAESQPKKNEKAEKEKS